MLALHVAAGPDAGKRFLLPDTEPQLIGRSTEALGSTDPSVSRRHAELTPSGGRWHLRDLHSTHGTWLNGQRIEARAELRAGDVIRCGATEFHVQAVDSASPAPAADADP